MSPKLSSGKKDKLKETILFILELLFSDILKRINLLFLFRNAKIEMYSCTEM